jgi:restriction endonuclease Mrr
MVTPVRRSIDDVYRFVRGYLSDSPQEWSAFVGTLCGELGNWAVSSIEENSLVEPNEHWASSPDEFSESLVEYLLSPEVPRRIIEAADAYYSVRPKRVRQALTALVNDVQNHLLDNLASNKIEVADKIEGIFAQHELSELVTRAIRASAANRASAARARDAGLQLIRLNVIDLALYKALKSNPELLYTLEWRVFERMLADMLERFGFEVELQRGTKDGGVDLFAVKRKGLMGAERFLLQAKRWKHNVGVEPIRQLAFLHQHHRVTKSCLATTATFTKGAWELGRQYAWQLELRDHEGLQEWISSVVDKTLASKG